MIRLPDLPAVPQQSIGSPPVSAAAVAAPAVALGRVAESIASVSDRFLDHAAKLQQIENARMVSEHRARLEQAYADHQLAMQSEMDPAARIEKTRAFLATARDSLIPADAPPVVRDSLANHFEDFAGRATIHQAEQASALTIRRAKTALENELAAAERAGDMTAAEDAIARAAVFATPEEQQKIRANIAARIKANNILAQIDADPIGSAATLDDPEFQQRHPDLDPDTVRQLRHQAEIKRNRTQDDFLNRVIISGENLTEDDLATLETSGMISLETRARYTQAIRAQQAKAPPAFDPAVYEDTYTRVMSYDPAKDPTGATVAQLRQYIASAPLPKESVAELNDRLNARLKPETHTPLTKLESDFAQKIASDFTRGDFGKYRFPVDHDKNPATAPITPINREAYDKAWNLRGQFAEQWRKTLETLPKTATFQDVQKAYDGLKQKFRDLKPVPAVIPPPVSAVPFDPDRALNPTPAAFGGQPVRAPGAFYPNAAATVFGGPNDPDDKGKSAFGGTTGKGGREGAAIPRAVLEANFPGKDKAWLAENVRVMVRTPNGVTHALPLADLGTAEWVWQRNQRPVLDLTPAAVRKLGGQIKLDRSGRMTGTSGLESLDFAVVSTATAKPLAGLTWDQAQDAWWAANRTHSEAAAFASLTALKQRWELTNAAPAK